MERLGHWMLTGSKRLFWPLAAYPEEVFIEDIAQSLAFQCRYAGHCDSVYTVAQHSVLVSEIVPKRYALWGLLHDASETYLVDLPRPVKNWSILGDEYKKIEIRLMSVIAIRFGLSIEEPKCIRQADNKVMATEIRDLMGPCPLPWDHKEKPLSVVIDPWSHDLARHLFLARFYELGGKYAQ